MNLPLFYRFLRLRVFVLRIGKDNQEPVFKIAYAVAVPFSATNAPNASISQFNKVGLSLSYKRDSTAETFTRRCSIAVITIVERTDVVCNIIADLLKGYSLADACRKWSIKLPVEADFNLYFSREMYELPTEIDTNFPGDITCSQTWQLQNQASLLTYDSIIPLDPNNAVVSIGEYIAKNLGVDRKIIIPRVGSIEVLFRPAYDADGHPFVVHSNPDDKTHLIAIRHELYDGADEVIVNARFTAGNRIMTDEVDHCAPPKGDKMELRFSSSMHPERTFIKIWLRKGKECRLVHNSAFCTIKQLDISMHIEGSQMRLFSEWHRKIREAMPGNKRVMVDDATKIARVTTERFSVGDVDKLHDVGQHSRPRIKPYDAFFPKGWNPSEGKDGEHGALEFLKWFRERTEGASDIMLQDPYFEDVALYFIASSESHARYTVITQTGLKTNPNGTAYVDNSSGPDSRADKILSLIQEYPTLFAGMQLVVKNITGSSTKLHDRYLIVTYPDGHSEGYSLSNSLQGATIKQPLLVTRIGDDALEKVMDYMSSNIRERAMARELITLYDSKEARARSATHSREIADPAFKNWVQTTFHIVKLLESPESCIRLILDDILHGPFSHSGAIPSKIATLGNMLASARPELEYQLKEKAVEVVRDSSEWIAILKDFILHSHDAEFPIGFRNCPNRGSLSHDLACLAELDYREVLSMSRMHLVEKSSCERDYFSTWGQHFACGILIEAAPAVAAETLMRLRKDIPTYKGDKVIYPTYLAANMLLHEMFSLVVCRNGEAVMRTLLSHNDKWLRGIGALMLLYCAMDKDFKLNDYKDLFASADEAVIVAHRALYLKPDVADKAAFYEWILTQACSDESARRNVVDEGVAFLKDAYSPDDRMEYVREVLVPLTEEKILEVEAVEISLTEALYTPTQESKSMTELLPFALKKIGASMTHLKKRLDATLKECDIAEGRLLLKNEESCFDINTKRRNITPLLELLEQSDSPKP